MFIQSRVASRGFDGKRVHVPSRHQLRRGDGNKIRPHKRSQNIRKDNRTIGSLILLENGDPSSTNRQTRTIKRMYEPWFGFGLRTVSDLGPPCLVVSKPRAAGDFSIGVLR